jgi:hypothetical protein
MYYALKRNADGMPDAKTGQNTAISATYRFTARRAYVVDPEILAKVNEPPYPRGQRTVIRRALFWEAISTKKISPYPLPKSNKQDEYPNGLAPSSPSANVDAPQVRNDTVRAITAAVSSPGK